MDNTSKKTKNLNLQLIYQGIENWSDYLNDNFNILDEVVSEASKSNSIINSIEPSTHKFGRVWVDKINQNGKVITGKYKVDNGTDYDELHFQTDAELVKCKDGKNVENKLQEIIQLEKEASKNYNKIIENNNIIQDCSTNKKYKFGIENGLVFIEEV